MTPVVWALILGAVILLTYTVVRRLRNGARIVDDADKALEEDPDFDAAYWSQIPDSWKRPR